MNREVWKRAIELARLKQFTAVLVDLDRADRSVAQQHVGEDPAAAAGEEVEHSHQFKDQGRGSGEKSELGPSETNRST